MDDIEKNTGKIARIYTENITLSEKFIDFAARFADMEGTVALISGGNLDCARFHVLAVKPWLAFKGIRQEMTIKLQDQTHQFTGDPFSTLREIIKIFKNDNLMDPGHNFPEPVCAGLFGYLSYDLKNSIEKLPRTSMDGLNLPEICFFAPSIIIIHDKIKQKTTLCVPERILNGKSSLDDDLEFFKAATAKPSPIDKGFWGDSDGFSSNFNKKDYLSTIEKIKEYIASGDVYQVNFSQRFEMDFTGGPYSLFKALYKKNPAPFFSYINAGDHHIVSTSPERFIMQKGQKVETRPIKGTRPRGKTADEDKNLKQELLQSKKDDAELSMIVDLLRNDMGKVCIPGSIRIGRHKMVEAYQNVYHLVSVVEGILDKKYDSIDLMAATFPGGSITGCPKIRAMEIIDELEPDIRHIYTGSLGYIGFNDTIDFSIAIRTATIHGNRIVFSVGGGIVYDSDPREEYEETLHKGNTLLGVFSKKNERQKDKPFIWINGKLQPLNQARIPVADPGFLYGYGFFETLRADNGTPWFLKEHMARFHKTWAELFKTKIQDLSWDRIIYNVLEKNGLTKKPAAVKILATKGDNETPPYNHTLIVMARAYAHRLSGKKEEGINLVTYPEPRQTPLADHKTLNYLYYLLAGKWAGEKNGDEALILNPDNTVSETNTGNIMGITDEKIFIPESPHVLPGIMQGLICKLLIKWGFAVETGKFTMGSLFSKKDVIVSNSLMGAVPVISLDNRKLPPPSDLFRKINCSLFGVEFSTK